MALIDEVVIRVQSGTGGNGCVSFRREKYIPRGGPNGGNGGRGGHVYLEATRDKMSLLDFKYRPRFEGKRGEHGMGKEMDGRAGDDLVIQVPTGTLVYDANTGDLLYDLIHHGQKVMVAPGGKGGRGNKTFATSTNRAPRMATPGELGQELELKLELRLLADVGLVGLPNAGKSSLLGAISRAHPKVADYPFTTLEPHLGVVDHKGTAFVMADLPGLIEGASEGVGLGHKFLRHVARNRILLHLVESNLSLESIQEHITVIRRELEAYDPALLDRKRVLVFTKIDLLDVSALAEKRHELAENGLSGFFISSHTGAGVEAMLDSLVLELKRARDEEAAAAAAKAITDEAENENDLPATSGEEL